jgi:hypothetical protein
MDLPPSVAILRRLASMGPRSDNRGYVVKRVKVKTAWQVLQWVHGRITVVMHHQFAGGHRTAVASMGPRSDNRGYASASLPNMVSHIRCSSASGERSWEHERAIRSDCTLPTPFVDGSYDSRAARTFNSTLSLNCQRTSRTTSACRHFSTSPLVGKVNTKTPRANRTTTILFRTGRIVPCKAIHILIGEKQYETLRFVRCQIRH